MKPYDKYDFDPGAYPENGNLLNQGISTGVNWAKDSEKKQVITNYHINIEFKNQFGG